MGRNRSKLRDKLNDHNKINLILNAKAMNVLYNVSDANESTIVKDCKSAKEIWNKLKEIHKSSDNVRE